MSYKWPPKDPNDILDYAVDWSARIATNDSITDSEWSVVDGSIILNAHEIQGTNTVVWLSGGAEGEICHVLNRIYTDGGRQMDQTVQIKIKSA